MNRLEGWLHLITPYLTAVELDRVTSLNYKTAETTRSWTPRELAQQVDHTLLNPDARPDDVARVCEEAVQWNTLSVCVNSGYVPLAHNYLSGTPVCVAAVVGFPLGAMATSVKAFETQCVVQEGAREIDMVLNLGRLKAQDYDGVVTDLRAVRGAAPAPIVLKVILETGLLTTDEKGLACLLSAAVGADYVKTSTGFGFGGATEDDVRLMRETVGWSVGVKASGGIRTWGDAIRLLDAGASRLGMSRTDAILREGVDRA